MELRFVGDMGIYVPQMDAIKFTAIYSGGPVQCYAKRSALVALGSRTTDDAAGLLAQFEIHRSILENAANARFSNGALGDITLTEGDIRKPILLRRIENG